MSATSRIPGPGKRRWALSLGLFLCLALGGGPCLLLAGSASGSSSPGEPAADPVVEILVQKIQEERRAAGAPPFVLAPALEEVTGELAAEVTRAGSWSTVDLSAERVAQMLEARGYFHYRLVSAYYAGRVGDPEAWVDDWMRRSRGTFDSLGEEVFRDLGIGRGGSRERRFYYLVAARNRVDFLREESAALADLAAVRREVLERVNRARREEGLRPMIADEDMDRVAQLYAEDMFARDFYGHFSPEGHGIRARVDALGSKKRRPRLGENLAGGHTRVEAVVDGWLASPAHRSNILEPRFRQLGVGLARGEKDGDFKILWVQVFAGYR